MLVLNYHKKDLFIFTFNRCLTFSVIPKRDIQIFAKGGFNTSNNKI